MSARFGKRVLEARQDVADRAGAQQGAADVQKLGGKQHRPALSLRQQRSHVVHAAQVDVAILAQQAPRLGGLGQPLPGQADVVGRQRFQHQLASGGEAGVGGQPLKDLVEFEDVEGFGVHTAKSIA